MKVGREINKDLFLGGIWHVIQHVSWLQALFNDKLESEQILPPSILALSIGSRETLTNVNKEVRSKMFIM